MQIVYGRMTRSRWWPSMIRFRAGWTQLRRFQLEIKKNHIPKHIVRLKINFKKKLDKFFNPQKIYSENPKNPKENLENSLEHEKSK